ncbi:WXG100 family type VII secretion target [Nocardioides sp.]|uniref:WXG100 family type VII secretion target n=1 Tax=Nocardioides sp. TaxID=35761 RepID=UPI0025E580C4|nr:WXG100 family type VII secretion target [Nocardioides sp.]
MSGQFTLDVHPGALRHAAATIATLHEELVHAATRLGAVPDEIEGQWTGAAASATIPEMRAMARALRTSAPHLETVRAKLVGLAEDYEQAQGRVRQLNRQWEDAAPRVPPDAEQDPEDPDGIRAWQHAVTASQNARAGLTQAMADLREHLAERTRACASALAAGLPVSVQPVCGPDGSPPVDATKLLASLPMTAARTLKDTMPPGPEGDQPSDSELVELMREAGSTVLDETEKFFTTWGGFAPPDDMGPITGAVYALGLAGNVAGAASDIALHGVLQNFQPLIDGHRYKLNGWRGFDASFWERFKAANNDSSWRAKPYRAAARDGWRTTGRWVNRAGTVVAGVAAGYDEWANSDETETDRRVTEAVTVGGATAAGAWAGAEGGAWLGGAIGTAICPGVGTVIGGFVGGVVGGFVGSEVGSAVGGAIKDGAADLVDGAGDLASDIGDAVKFW